METRGIAGHGGDRVGSIDTLRGVIMVIMAVDHVSVFVSHQHSFEFWTGAITRYTSTLAFLTRFVTHLCAPGFFFLMGAGIAMLSQSRTNPGWYLAKRGLLLLAVNQVLENPALMLGIAFQVGEGVTSGSGSPSPLMFGVLSGLGMSMLLGSLLIRFRSGVWLIASAAALLATNLIIPMLDPKSGYQLFERLLLIPGASGQAIVAYPVLPWFPLVGLGVVFGRRLREDTAATMRAVPWVGLLLLAAAVALRAAGGFGNIQLPRDGSWIEFLNFVKYPPPLVFVLFTLGANLILLSGLAKVEGAAAEILRVYGRTPLCYYLAHLYLYALVGAAFFQHAAPMSWTYAIWIAGLLPLYFI
ncbi:MAG: heparan-alpha-glucosaminide N-acetyltransferase domain-containing protein [Bryobacteraceae bacterium]